MKLLTIFSRPEINFRFRDLKLKVNTFSEQFFVVPAGGTINSESGTFDDGVEEWWSKFSVVFLTVFSLLGGYKV